MWKVWQYSAYDLLRSRWTYIYFAFFLIVSFSLLRMSSSLMMAVVSLVNIVNILIPLIGTIFGAIYFYNSREFMELLISQPLKRRSLFLGHYLGLASSLAGSFLLGMGIPFVFFRIWQSDQFGNFLSLMFTGILLTFIFVGIAYLIALLNDNKVKGFGIAIVVWLFMVVLYDGLFILLLVAFEDYPLEKFSLAASFLNPVDLSRIFVMLKLDIAALMGYTGAVFSKFLGSSNGIFLSVALMLIWIFVPLLAYLRIARKKDF